ncbi:MAG: GTP-binding protein [Candidatus Thorarchaeota archaeon]
MSSSLSEETLADYYRVVFLGSPEVGKTTMINWILDLPFSEEYHPSTGVRFHNIDTILGENQYFLQFCDVSGNEVYSNSISPFLKAASIAILVFDYKNKNSQLEIQRYYSKVSKVLPPTQILLIGNKFENEKNKIPKSLSNWIKSQNLAIYPISVHENIGKSLLMQNIIQIIAEVSNKQE